MQVVVLRVFNYPTVSIFSWHSWRLFNIQMCIGCLAVYLIIISCYATAMTSPSYPSTKNYYYS